MTPSFETLLSAQDIVRLDGATGTELQRRGFETPLPLWTAEAARRAPDLLHRIHADYLHAGADIVTANTFRTQPYTLRRVGREAEALDLTLASVAMARAACRDAGRGLVAGGMAPLEDCYHPELAPPEDVARHEHALHARNLAEAGVDLLLVETMNTLDEALAAAEAALATGLPVVVSCILRQDGALLSGEDLAATLAGLRAVAVSGRRLAGVALNCASPATLLAALEGSAESSEPCLGAYANVGIPAGITPDDYGAWARACRDRGARLLGGCCGTTPEHIAAVTRALAT